jgi:hypothetical protein
MTYKQRMQVRHLIMSCLRAHGSIAHVAQVVGCHRTLLYHFEAGSRTLGPGLVSRIRCRIPECKSVTDEQWLAAMGVDVDCEVTDAP